jgi:hypothetical protein
MKKIKRFIYIVSIYNNGEDLVSCIKCGIELNSENWYVSFIKHNKKMCKECHLEYTKKYYMNNREQKNSYSKSWYVENKEEISKNNKEDYNNNIEKYRLKNRLSYLKHRNDRLEYQKKYYEDEIHREENRETMKHNYIEHKERYKANRDKRERELEFIPLNKPFEKCHGHHIDKKYVIYIPMNIHRSIYHNVFTGEGMGKINLIALRWLENEEIPN